MSEASRLLAFLWIPSLLQQITVINTTLFSSSRPFFTAWGILQTSKRKRFQPFVWNFWDTKHPWWEDYLITKMNLTTVQDLPCRLNLPKCSVFNTTRKKQNCCTCAGNALLHREGSAPFRGRMLLAGWCETAALKIHPSLFMLCL